MTTTPVTTKPEQEQVNLSELGDFVLNGFYQSHLESAMKTCAGSGSFQKRKEIEYREFLALAQISGRINPLAANLEQALQFHFILNAPVGVLNSKNELEIKDWAHISLTYPEEALRKAMPGYAFVRVLQPGGVWHPNAARPDCPDPFPGQVLCLGQSIPPGIRVRELVLMTFGALTLQSVQLDARDPAGVLNVEAAEWWLQNRSEIPLTREPFLKAKS